MSNHDDAGSNPKSAHESNRLRARVFDTLVDSNVALVRTIKLSMHVMMAFGMISTLMTGISAMILRSGQVETRALIVSLSARTLCTDPVPAPDHERTIR